MYTDMKDSNQDELVKCIFVLLVTREWLASYLPDEYGCQSGIWSAMHWVLPHKGCLLRSLELNEENGPCMSQCSFMSLTSLRWLIDILIILPSISLNLASVLYRVHHWFLAIRIQIWWDKFDLLWCKKPGPHNKPCVYMLFSAIVQPLNFSVQKGMCRPMLKQIQRISLHRFQVDASFVP